MRYNAAKKTDKAVKAMVRSLSKSPDNADAYAQLGQWYFQQHRFTEAADLFKQASAKCRNGGKRFAKPYAKSLLYAGRPYVALQIINTYETKKDSAEWNRMRAQAYFIKDAMASHTAPWPVNLGIRINTGDPELFPAMAVDTQTLYFTRRMNNMDDDFFVAHTDSCGGWFSARNMGYLPNTPDQESAQFISADGHYLFFTRCENRSLDGWSEGGCDLLMAYRTALDSDWTIAQPFGSTINTPDYEGMPSLSPDERELYFVSDREGGYGGYDIWMSRFEDGLWQLPVNAGPTINTPGNETAPYIALDNKTLYFTSDGWPGMGGSDLFVSHRAGDKWGDAINLGYPVNTAHDEKSACVDMTGEQMYFGSDRGGPAGNYDIYKAALSPQLQPLPIGFLQGYVFDSLTKGRLNYALIFICNVATGDTIYRFRSNRGDGSYLITLELGKYYAIHTARMSYLNTSDTIFFDKKYLGSHVTRNIPMLPSNYDEIKPINDTLIATVHFDVNKVELPDSDKTILRDAIAPWLHTKGIVIYVNAYTDNTGTPMINEELSQKRAELIAHELQSSGIDEGMIRAKGWGEAKMVASNDTEDGQRKNRRVEVIIKR